MKVTDSDKHCSLLHCSFAFKFQTRMKVTDNDKHTSSLVGSLACKYQASMEVTDNEKHSSLLHFNLVYGGSDCQLQTLQLTTNAVLLANIELGWK